jgi:dipeptidyl aminopeptidase/acylaminoacyl peptidase
MRVCTVVVSSLLLSSAIAAAQPAARPATASAILDDLAVTHVFEEIAVSPDGRRVAWVESVIENGRDTGRAAVFAAPIDGAKPAVKLGEGRRIAWSHDGARIAYVDKQLFVAAIAGGAARQVTKLDGYLADPAWSPDDSRIAILFAEHAASGGGPLGPEPIETGVIGAAIHNQRLTLIDPRTGAAQPVSPAELHVYEYDWSPDGARFALTAAPGPGDNNWWTAKLYTIAAVAGAAPGAPSPIYKPALQIAEPRWSPDGAQIGFIEGLMSDEGFTGGDVMTIAAAGGAPSNRTAGRQASPSTLSWLSPSQLLIAEYAGGGSAIAAIDLRTGAIERRWQGDEALHRGQFANYAASRDGKIVAAVRSDWQHAPEIWAGPIGGWKQITTLNAARRPAWGQARSLSWTSDRFSVQGWLIYPREFDAAKRYPMIVSPHGGPAGITTPRWPRAGFDAALFSALGYFVLLPNARGSYGQGEAFTRANVKDFGGGDLRDILAGVDAALKTAPIDPARIGLTGWSYGGYMTMWAITQTKRFRAAVAGAGIANWQSYYGQNAIDQWMIPYFGASVYDDPAVYARSAPISFVKQIATPTLIVVGERDGECPPPQSYELWHALKTLGVPTDLVIYPGEGHMFRDSGHKRDVLERAAAWFDKYLR